MPYNIPTASLPAPYTGPNLTEDQIVYNSVRATLLMYIKSIALGLKLSKFDSNVDEALSKDRRDQHSEIVQDVFCHYLKVLETYRRCKPKPDKPKAVFNTYLTTALRHFAGNYVKKYQKKYSNEQYITYDNMSRDSEIPDNYDLFESVERESLLDAFKDKLDFEELAFLKLRLEGNTYSEAFLKMGSMYGKVYTLKAQTRLRASLQDKYLDYIK